MNNPVEEYLQVKEAGFWSGLQKTVSSPYVAAPLATLGAAVVGRSVLRGLDKVILAITKKRDFNNMMEHSPDLQESYQEDPKRFNAHFTSLRSMNPQFSGDPIVAGSYMRQMSASPATAGTAVVHAIGAGRGLAPGPLAATAEGRFPEVKMPMPYGREQEGRAQAKDVREQEMHAIRQEQAETAGG